VNALLDEALSVLSINHVSHTKEEGVRELLGLTSLFDNIAEDLIHGDYGHSEVDSKALGNLILEDVRRTEENDLWLNRPTADEATIFIKETLLQACFQVAQPHFIF
jgi:hypothetical protein